MSISRYSPVNRGTVYRAPTLRVYHSRVVTTNADGAIQPCWLRPRRAEYWQPLKLSWGTNGQLSTLTLKRQLGVTAAGVDCEHPEGIDILEGDMIRMVQCSAGNGPARGRRVEWFRGYVAKRQIVIEPDNETLEVTAYGPEIRLKGKVICGQWHKTASADDSEIQGTLSANQAIRSNVFQSNLPAIFNEGGRPNASKSVWLLASNDIATATNSCKVFEAPHRQVIYNNSTTVEAEHWTTYAALRSLVEYCDNYEVISPHTSWQQIQTLLGDTPIGEVRIEGMNLLEAMKAILLPVGFGFCLQPWTAGNGRDERGLARHRLSVFPLRDPAVVKLPRLAPIHNGNVAADSLQGRRVELQRLNFLRDSHRIVNDITVVGDQKRVQIVLEFNNDAEDRDLQPLWDTDTHDLDDWADSNIVDPWQWSDSGDFTFENFAGKYNRSGKDYWQYKHVFRSFAWNEDGSFASLINQIPDLTEYGLGSEGYYIRRPRPLASTFTYDSDRQKVRLHPRKVQLGIVGDDNSWIDIPAEIWNDRAGFTISTPLLAGNAGDGQWYPYAAHKQYSDTYRNLHYLTLLHNALRDGGDYKLRLRLIGSIECDRAVLGEAPKRLQSAWPFRAQKVLRLGSRFKWREIQDAPFSGESQSNCINDTSDATDYAEQIRDTEEDCTARGKAVLRYLTRSYVPGDGIGGTAGRSVDLHIDGGQRLYAPVVIGIVWDFEDGANKTELLLDNPAAWVTK